jgi:hypothetical protein
MKRKVNLTVLLLFSLLSFSQHNKSTKIGRATMKELNMKVYEKDTTATAVVLYEHKNLYMDASREYNIRTDYYYRIKILDKNSFDLSEITIDLYKEKKAIDIKGITYNLNDSGGLQKTVLQEKDIFTEKYNDNFTLKKFTLPNIKEGSVIEYSYSILSPYSGIQDWYFQSDIPKVKSEFDYALIGNYEYNLRLIGNLKLDKNESSVKRECIHIDGVGDGDCLVYSFGMNDIPAFKEEDYMLSKKNYLSRISFDLKAYSSIYGGKSKYTSSWKDADKSLKKFFFNNQTSKKSFFEKQLPEAFFAIENDLEKAKKIFYFLQDHYVWNGDFWTNEDAKVKQAFNRKSGNVGEINLSLYNSLVAADLDANLVVLSTRNNGIPTKIIPVIFDFNYVIVQLKIEDNTYYLDATSDFLPFGELPVRTLNGEARLINFKKESTWIRLASKNKTYQKSSAQLSLTEEGEITGTLNVINSGYFAADTRSELYNTKKEKYLEDFETEHPDIEVDDYSNSIDEDLNKPTEEKFTITLFMDESLGDVTRINPFFFNRIKENPFKLKERFYPVDFAFPRSNMYNLSLQIPDNYTITNIPESKAFALPNKGGVFSITYHKTNNTINLFIRMSIKKRIYSSAEYYYLKQFYNQIIQEENNYITLEKK